MVYGSHFCLVSCTYVAIPAPCFWGWDVAFIISCSGSNCTGTKRRNPKWKLHRFRWDLLLAFSWGPYNRPVIWPHARPRPRRPMRPRRLRSQRLGPKSQVSTRGSWPVAQTNIYKIYLSIYINYVVLYWICNPPKSDPNSIHNPTDLPSHTLCALSLSLSFSASVSVPVPVPVPVRLPHSLPVSPAYDTLSINVIQCHICNMYINACI